MSESGGFIVLHIGAGYHSLTKENQYKQLCKDACTLAMSLIDTGHTSLDIVKNVCSFLEDSYLTNAGYGSNLTIAGTVECDCAVMESRNGGFAGVACLKDVKNPIQLAVQLLNEQTTSNTDLIPPIMLVGEGAREKAVYHGLKMVEEDGLTTSKSLHDYHKYKRVLAEDTVDHSSKRTRNNDHDSLLYKEALHDTIGVICIDKQGKMTSAISSGGLVLKQPGRVGHSAHFGCGCWAFDYTCDVSVASCTSGSGEFLIRTNLAKELCDYCYKCSDDQILDLNLFLEETFLHSPYLKSTHHPKYCGVLVLKLSRDVETQERNVDLHVAHTSYSFCYGFMMSGMKLPKAAISRLDEQLAGKKVVSQAFHFNMKSKNKHFN